jgi:hypothetical protein
MSRKVSGEAMNMISKHWIAIAIGMSLAADMALAQSHQPYAGLQGRPIKALSEEQLADLRAGRGMSLALAAELNGYPGPLHVIELADALSLTPSQRSRFQELVQEMKAEAVVLGERLIGQEAELDRQFSQQTVTVAALDATTSAIGKTQAQLRAAHLRYHLLTAEVMTSDQVRRYNELRGYSGVGQKNDHNRNHHQ